MKILYAASNRKGAQLQLLRFLSFLSNHHQIKIAGFNKSLPNINFDWTLDALQNVFDVSHLSFDNDNLRVYYEQIKSYSPDLIISDLELYTSYIGIQLSIPVWQVSPNLLYYGMNQQDKVNSNIYRHYSYFFNRQNMPDDILQNILVNSDKKFIYSHFGDAGNINLNSGYEWVRPYAIIGKDSVPCQHNVFAATLKNDKKYINYLKNFKDVVLFSSFLEEEYTGISMKDILNFSEYACNVKNCTIGVSQGYTDLLADLYYAGKPCLVLPDFTQSECIVNAMLTEYLKLGKVIYQNEYIAPKAINIQIDEKIDLLHNKLEN